MNSNEDKPTYLPPGILGTYHDRNGKALVTAEHKGNGVWLVEMFGITALRDLGEDLEKVTTLLAAECAEVEREAKRMCEAVSPRRLARRSSSTLTLSAQCA